MRMTAPQKLISPMSFLVALVGHLLVNNLANAQTFVPLSLGPDFQAPLGETDILRGFKSNIADGESPFKAHVFDGTLVEKPFRNEFTESKVIKSTEELKEMMEIEGTLSVSYGPMISGEGSGSYLSDKVNSKRSATMLYRTRRVAYARSVDVATLAPAEGTNLNNMRGDQIADIYGTKFIDQIVYGAQLDVIFEVTSNSDVDLLEIEAGLKGEIGIGPLSVGFSANFELNEGSEKSDMEVNILAQATGVNFSTKPNPSIDEVAEMIAEFNQRYQQINEDLSLFDSLGDEGNVLNQLSPVGFTLSSIADHLPTKLDSVELAFLDTKMEELRDVFHTALYWRSRLISDRDVQANIYADPRERDEIFQPYSEQVDIVLDQLNDKIEECVVYRRQPLQNIVGRGGIQAAVVPEMYPKSDDGVDSIQGLTGEIYLPSPLTIGTTTFPEFHYIGFALPTSSGDFLPWMSGELRRDSNNEVVAKSETTPDVLEQIGYAALNGIIIDPNAATGGVEYVRYGEPLHMQVNNLDNRWLSGYRGGIGKVETLDVLGSDYEFDLIDTYTWIPRGAIGNEDEDPRDGDCVRYGDTIYLQNSYLPEQIAKSKYQWLSSSPPAPLESFDKEVCFVANSCPDGTADGGQIGIIIRNNVPRQFGSGAAFNTGTSGYVSYFIYKTDWDWSHPRICCGTSVPSDIVSSKAMCADGEDVMRIGHILNKQNGDPYGQGGGEYNSGWNWRHPFLCDAGSEHSCMFAAQCPTGLSDKGHAGVIMKVGEEKFGKGAALNDGWNWVHPRLCCNEDLVALTGKAGDSVWTIDPTTPSEQTDERIPHYEWIVRSTMGDGARDLSSNPDPANGECLQPSSFLYLQSNEIDNQWLSGGRGDDNNQVFARSDSGVPSYQWIVRQSIGDGTRTDGFYCGVIDDTVRGRWVPVQYNEPSRGTQTVEFTYGISDREVGTDFGDWTNNNSWEDSVIDSIAGGFGFGDDNLYTGWLVGYELTSQSSSSSSMDIRNSLAYSAASQLTQLPSGQVWQFVFEMGDICDRSWDLQTDTLVVTSSFDEPPCCLPGFEVDDLHGPCKLSTACQCGESICGPQSGPLTGGGGSSQEFRSGAVVVGGPRSLFAVAAVGLAMSIVAFFVF